MRGSLLDRGLSKVYRTRVQVGWQPADVSLRLAACDQGGIQHAYADPSARQALKKCISEPFSFLDGFPWGGCGNLDTFSENAPKQEVHNGGRLGDKTIQFKALRALVGALCEPGACTLGYSTQGT